MKGMWIRIVLVTAALGAAAGCGGDDTNATGSGASGGGGSGGSGGTGGSGGAGGSGGTGGSGGAGATTSMGSGGTTTTEAPICDGVLDDFMPEWKPSEGIHQGLCADATQIADFFKACIEPSGSEADCNAFVDASAENAACAMCAVSAPGDAEYGPMTIYEVPAVLYENPGQCISEIEGDASDASCGAKVFFTIQCQVTACDDCEDFESLLDCLEVAKTGSCKPQADAEAQCVTDLQGQGVDIDVCLPPQNATEAQFYQYLKDMTLFHCGP